MSRVKTYNLTILQGLFALSKALITMKMQPDRILGQTVTGHGAGWISLDGEKFHHSMLITWSGVREVWNEEITHLADAQLINSILQVQPEILLLGCGNTRIGMPANQLTPLLARNIGVEIMDTAAACRTYNILAAENRKVAAILLIYE